MVHERAEGWPQGWSWLILAIALAGVLPDSSQAQDKPPGTTKGSTGASSKAEDAAQAVAPPRP